MLILHAFSAFFSSGFFLSHPVYKAFKGKFSLGAGCGLVGSAWALVAWLTIKPLNLQETWTFILTVTAASTLISHWAGFYYGKKDDSRIVIDEFAGYLWSVVFLPKTALCLILGFILFRVFDVYKPFGIRRLENLPGGIGVVMDDVASGWATYLLLRGLLALTNVAAPGL